MLDIGRHIGPALAFPSFGERRVPWFVLKKYSTTAVNVNTYCMLHL